jgi:hypothetical protein
MLPVQATLQVTIIVLLGGDEKHDLNHHQNMNSLIDEIFAEMIENHINFNLYC